MGTRSLDDAIEASHNALAAIINGDPSGYRALYAEDEVPTLGNPFGPFAHEPSPNMSRTILRVWSKLKAIEPRLAAARI
jgi:hypothetical protein